mgnify:CR=1 FL=1
MEERKIVTILILIDGFLQFHKLSIKQIVEQVTILILIDGFLQFMANKIEIASFKSQSLF